jgi:hypothetical protein
MRKLTTDHAFHIGQRHFRSGMPCQDYATSGQSKDGAFALAADGCSSGGRTEVGAQILAMAAALSLRPEAGINSKMFLADTYLAMGRAQAALDLEQRDMLATLVVARAGHREGAIAEFIGDGAAAFVYADGAMTIAKVEWQNNMPPYLAYRDDGYRGFIKAHGGELAFACEFEGVHLDPAGVQTGEWKSSRPVGSALDHRSIILWPSNGHVKLVAVFTDGVMQVDGMHWTQVIRELLSFKSLTGDFVKRRMRRFLEPKGGEVQRIAQDDIGCAAIQIEES